MRRMLPIVTAAALLLTIAAPAAAGHHHRAAAGPDLIQTAAAAGTFQTLLAAVEAAGLTDTLRGDGPFTLFAPTDEAFAALPQGAVQSLLEPANRDALTAVLTYHVVSGELPAARIGASTSATTVNGQRLDLELASGRLRVDEAGVLTADLRTANGIIHVIDRVLQPADQSIVGLARAAGSFETLLAAAGAAELAGTLSDGGPFTVFAPTDEAFAALPEGTVETLLAEEGRGTLKKILAYHVLDGRVYADDALAAGRAETLAGEALTLGVADGRFQVDESGIVQADLEAANGVVHVIDRVLLPAGLRPAAVSTVGDAVSASELIRLAIRRGVPLFNSGAAGACAAVYEVAAKSLVGGRYDLPPAALEALESGLREARHSAGDRERAWALRYALDAAMLALGDRMSSR